MQSSFNAVDVWSCIQCEHLAQMFNNTFSSKQAEIVFRLDWMEVYHLPAHFFQIWCYFADQMFDVRS